MLCIMPCQSRTTPESPWYRVWGAVLEQLTSVDENMMAYPHPRFAPSFTQSYRCPDFNISEIIVNGEDQRVRTYIQLIVELKVPTQEHTAEDPRNVRNMGESLTAQEQLNWQAAYLFATEDAPNEVVGLVGVGCLWGLVRYTKRLPRPRRREGETNLDRKTENDPGLHGILR
ncbi:hypothetical protein BS47DRAFT_957383 [Hydnum rufescens UP504]|uniref:Uncharacterized protein n=1 Tax=Hydnum rufescens UP504 TaxID=1448309 RepID=A0A9P6DE95_9AGAM|nr:hypothetical protein BS47DRAFT_957383 [Hydnum rufescens UP504]